MKVLVFGHSYVRDLRRFGHWDRELEVKGEKISIVFEFQSFPGKDFGYFLANPNEIAKVSEVEPDIVIVVLGGNAIIDARSNTEIKKQALAFYTKLKSAVKPSCLVLAMQIEPRFMSAGNRFGVPQAEEYNRRRQIINNFLNQTIKKQHLVDRVILLGAANYLNDPQLFRDGVHLRGLGLERYKEAILGGIRYALENRE